MTALPLLGRLRKAMRSADAARPRPDRIAVSPAIGPLPAIVVPVSVDDRDVRIGAAPRTGRVQVGEVADDHNL